MTNVLSPSSAATPRRLIVLGATGSIGRSVADVVEHTSGQFEVEAVVGGSDAHALAHMAIRLKARIAAIADETALQDLRAYLAGSGIEAAAGSQAVLEAASRPADIVVAAIVGTAGVLPTYAAVQQGRRIALANKECLVCAGAPFMSAVKTYHADILPMDSEHNALFQAIADRPVSSISRMTLTASGGPFRDWTAQQIAAATPAQALQHPNWSMGPKVTIDSARLMNKGLELIEAHFLFGIEADRLDVLVHPQSIVHGMVSFDDGSVIAGMAMPDMRIPIAHCLAYPARVATRVKPLDLAAIGRLDFSAPDVIRFPALRLAYDVLRDGGALPTVMNAANEIVVAAFLAGHINFTAMNDIVKRVCDIAMRSHKNITLTAIDEALHIDAWARLEAKECVTTFG
jgi:1-deoxy-D-xylulose-5-phosphate reductoisomerase